jgi:hypothetical protein
LLCLLWPAVTGAATAEELLGKALQQMLAPGEGTTSEAVFAAPEGVAAEADLRLAARVRYSFKAPRARVEATDAATKAVRLFVHDGSQAWLVTPVGATRLSESAAEVRRLALEQLFPLGLSATGARATARAEAGGRPLQGVEGAGPDGPWGLWVDAGDGRVLSYRIRGGELTGELTYGSGGALRKVLVRNAQGRIVLARYRDLPAREAVDEAAFALTPARGGDLAQALGRGMTPGRAAGPAVTATAGARGVDEEAQQKQLGKMRLDYQALAEMERARVADEMLEQFLRNGRLGRYRE